jgi:hypothetical protein
MSTQTVSLFFPEGIEHYQADFFCKVKDFTEMLNKDLLIKEVFPDGFCLYNIEGKSMNSESLIPNRIRIRLPKEDLSEWSDPLFVSQDEIDHWDLLLENMKKLL